MLLTLAVTPHAQAQTQSVAKSAQTPSQPSQLPPAGSVSGVGDVNVYPKRIVIDQKQRVGTMGLFNRAAAQGDYDISVTDMMMTPEGQLVELGMVKDDAERARVKTASSMLRWSPRRVTLASHDSQTVRLMARVPPELPAGEYRTHISAVAVPDAASTGLTIEQATGGQSGPRIGVTIVPRFGISIPVIVRVGETTLTTGLRDLTAATLPNGGRTLSLVITREGNRSAFGDLLVTIAGTKTKIAEMKGIGVYPEISQRSVRIPVDPEVDPHLLTRGTRLTVTYTDDDVSPGKVLAKQDFTLP